MKDDKTSKKPGSDNQGADPKDSRDTGGEFSIEQAKDYTLRLIERLRRKAVREARKDCGKFILSRMVEEIHCILRPVFDTDEVLTVDARAAALDAVRVLMDNGELDSYLNDWITPNVYYQMCSDMMNALDREKDFREAHRNHREREPALITVRFTVATDPEPVTAVINLDDLSPAQRDWLADRLVNQDVCQLFHGGDGTFKLFGENREPELVVAETPTAQALMAAIEEEQQVIKERRYQHQRCALAVARQIAEIGA